ncbi:MAG: chloride channel protein [Bacteroidia bacterium]
MFRRLRIQTRVRFFHFIRYRQRYINDRNFLILASLIVGVLSGFAAVSLKTIVHFIQHLLQGSFDVKLENFLYLLYPLIGIIICIRYVRMFHKKILFDKGLSSIIYSISKKSSNVEWHKTYSHIITSAFTVAFGGSVGLEAPIAVTGSAIGSNTAKTLLLTRQEKTLLLASGAAAGIAAIFNSPIAGVIFAFEVLLSEVSVPAFIPLLIASASGAVVSKLFYHEQLFFLTTEGWRIKAIPFYLLLGACCGLLSVYMIRTTIAVEGFFNRRRNPYFKGIFGGIAIGAMIFFFPPLYGEGYNSVTELLSGNSANLLDKSLFFKYHHSEIFLMLFALSVILIKVFATSVTIGAGGNGGIFAPSIFTGALLGFLFSHFINFSGVTHLNEQNFIAAAMGGLISGVLHAPLTGIFLIAEISGGYGLFVPLMLVSATSYFVVRYFEPHSIYTKSLIDRGLLTDDKDEQIFSEINLWSIIETDFSSVHPEMTLRELVKIISSSKRNIFPVVNHVNKFEGIIVLDDIREVMFREELYDEISLVELMSIPPVIANINDRSDLLMKKFEENGIWNIPVVDADEKYLGFVSKTGMLDKFREKLQNKNELSV